MVCIDQLNQFLSQHCRVRSVIQPKIQRNSSNPVSAKRINSKNLSFSSFMNKEMIRIPSMSWYIQNCILPKKGKEIQETIEEYIRSGGSIHSKSLPKQLANKRKSAQVSGKNSFN